MTINKNLSLAKTPAGGRVFLNRIGIVGVECLVALKNLVSLFSDLLYSYNAITPGHLGHRSQDLSNIKENIYTLLLIVIYKRFSENSQ